MTITYHFLQPKDFTDDLLASFDRYQQVDGWWQRIDGTWTLRDDAPFSEQWDEADKARVISEMLDAVRCGGIAYGAFDCDALVGFCSVKSRPFGSRGQYLELSKLHCSNTHRRLRIGRYLLKLACDAARSLGGTKLYISAHSSVESQAFYRTMGCIDAEEIDPVLYAAEPYNCHLELIL